MLGVLALAAETAVTAVAVLAREGHGALRFGGPVGPDATPPPVPGVQGAVRLPGRRSVSASAVGSLGGPSRDPAVVATAVRGVPADRTTPAERANSSGRPRSRRSVAPTPVADAASANGRIAAMAARLASCPADEAAALANRLESAARELGPQVSQENRAALVTLLSSVADPGAVLHVGEALAWGGRDAPTARRLSALLRRYADDGPRFAAICAALGGAATERDVAELAAWLDPARPDALRPVAGALARIGGGDAEGALVAVLATDLAPQQRHAVEGVWRYVDSGSAYETAAAALASASPAQAVSLLRVLRDGADARFAPQVLAVLARRPEGVLLAETARTLASFGDGDSVDGVLRCLAEGGPSGRLAEQALREATAPAALDRFAARWDALGPEARQALLAAAARSASPPDSLLNAATAAPADPNDVVRRLAATALGRPGRDAAVAPLAEFLGSPQTDASRRAALHALRRIGTPAASAAALDAITRDPGSAGSELSTAFGVAAAPR